MKQFILSIIVLILSEAGPCIAECPFEEKPEVVLPSAGDVRCVTVTDDKPANEIYFDNERIQASGVIFYSAFRGHLKFRENTPTLCFDKDKNLINYNLDFDNEIKNNVTRAEIVTCRNFWTNGEEVCSAPECDHYINQPKDTKYFEEELYITLNMYDIAALDVTNGIRVVAFNTPSDPRFIYNITTNTSIHLSTSEFKELCSKYGPCTEGRFEKTSDLMYEFGAYPCLAMKKNTKSNTIFIVVRNDPRPFIVRAKFSRCPLGVGRDSRVCTNSFGTQSFKKLWERQLPYHKEWLPLKFHLKWSYKKDCYINVKDTETSEVLVDFTGPCGRHVDMKRGNFPIAKIGPYTHSIQAPLKVRYKDIRINQIGSV